MNDIVAEQQRIAEACEGPTLRLIIYKWAPFAMAVFRTCFGQQSRSVKSERLHVQVDVYLDELRSLGYPVPPNTQGRALCVSWMNARWLKRLPTDDGGEAYELTSHALAALRVVEGLAQERALLSESRLTTILDAVRRLAVQANPDRQSRITALDADIARLTAERNRLADGGELSRATDERMLNGYTDVADLIGQLPGDFKRVEEALESIHRAMVKEFRADERPKGEVLDTYLEASEHLASQTEEGRAFEGALAILNDEDLLDEFRTGLRAIMDHPFAEALGAQERRDFLDAATILRRGLYDVQMRQIGASKSLQEHLASYDSSLQRELTSVLRRLEQELAIWMEGARVRDRVPMPWMPAKLEVDHLKDRFYDPALDRPVPPLADVWDEAPEPLSLEEVRRYGGPLLADVQAGVVGALLDKDADTMGAAFNELDAGLRRPVELYGLMQLATDIGATDHDPDGTEIAETVRPDGSRRRLTMPRVKVTARQVLDERTARR